LPTFKWRSRVLDDFVVAYFIGLPRTIENNDARA